MLFFALQFILGCTQDEAVYKINSAPEFVSFGITPSEQVQTNSLVTCIYALQDDDGDPLRQ